MPRYSEHQARVAVAAASTLTDALRRLDLCTTGGNREVLVAWAERWGISMEHFDPDRVRREGLRRPTRPIDELLVENADGSRVNLKMRLFREGLKRRSCEMCGQGEEWQGSRMALILDHVNGVRNDNRLENLRILCPNCNATLDTHCGRKNALPKEPINCLRCGKPFLPDRSTLRYCSRECGQRAARPYAGVARPHLRRAERPSHAHLIAEIAELGWSGTGRKYGVSDNAVRKCVRQYERDEATDDP